MRYLGSLASTALVSRPLSIPIPIMKLTPHCTNSFRKNVKDCQCGITNTSINLCVPALRSRAIIYWNLTRHANRGSQAEFRHGQYWRIRYPHRIDAYPPRDRLLSLWEVGDWFLSKSIAVDQFVKNWILKKCLEQRAIFSHTKSAQHCPQVNALFPMLNPKEHLEFYWHSLTWSFYEFQIAFC